MATDEVDAKKRGGQLDQFDEFEFKPLTKGLGFHQKTVDLSNEVKTSGIAKQESRPQAAAEAVSRLISSIPTIGGSPYQGISAEKPNLETPRAKLSAPEPTLRSPKFQDLGIGETSRETGGNLNISTSTSKLDFAEPIKNRVSSEPLPVVLKEKPFSLGAFFFDGLVVAGLSCLFTGIVLAITDSQLATVIEGAQSDFWTMASLVLLVLSVIQLYLILARSFFGATLGEWALDLTMGNQRQHQSAWFPIAIAWRSFLVMATGFITLPLISLLARRDLAGWVSGVKLYRKS